MYKFPNKCIFNYVILYDPIYFNQHVNGINLLQIPARDAYAYGRNLFEVLFNPLLQRIFLLTIVVVVVFSATGCWCITNLK